VLSSFQSSLRRGKPDGGGASYFKALPGSFFHLVGRPESDTQRYDLNSIEFKETGTER
jgi:hypothetical protein